MKSGIIVLLTCFASLHGYEDVTLVEFIKHHHFDFFTNAIERTGLTQILSQTGPYTALVPTDAAFDAMGQDKLNQYSTTQLKSIIKYHIVDGYILSPMVNSPQNFTTLLGEPVTIEKSRGTSQSVLFNGQAELDRSNNDFIVNNGVIQQIDTVLMPPDEYLTAETIAQLLIIDDGKFKDLLLAFMLGEMLNILEHNEFTLFAPTDAAFASHRDQILAPHDPNEPRHYQEVLKNHIVPGAFRAKDLSDGMKLFTLNGTPVFINRDGTGLRVNNITVSQTDIFASNGFIHAIDDVLVPPDLIPSSRR